MTKSPSCPVYWVVSGESALAVVKMAGAEVLSEQTRPDELKPCFAALAAGSLDALDELYDRCAADIFGLALWRTGCREDAADVVQEVFVRLARTRAELGKVRDPRNYLLGMAHRAAIDVVRKRRRTVELDDVLLVGEDVDPAGAADASRVSGLLLGLPAEQREAVYLRHFGELSFAEIGSATGVPTFTAASRYRLGIGRLRRLLGVKP